MKKIINKKTKIIVLMIALLSVMSCSDDFLNVVPEGSYTVDNFYASNDALKAGCNPLYNRAWFSFHERAWLGMGSIRAWDAFNPSFTNNFSLFRTAATDREVVYSRSAIYTAVAFANDIIEAVKSKCGPAVTQEAKNTALGEAYLTRGTAYFFGLRIWGPMILSESNTDMILHPIRKLNPEIDVLNFAIRDFRKAAEYLPEKDATGRATLWAAKAMLAKALLARSGWNKNGAPRDAADLAECIAVCEDVIDRSGLKLLDNYENLFRYQYNINPESLYAMRWIQGSTSDHWGDINTMLSDLTWPAMMGDDDISVWGLGFCPSVDMIELYNEEPWNCDRIRRKATFFVPGEHYDYLWSAHGGYDYEEDWMRVKKGVPGRQEDNDGKLYTMSSTLDTYIIRLADVYLMHAEASLGNADELTGGRGLETFNALRNRAQVSPKDKITFEDIIKERRIEFCMECQTWFEMITWYRWKPDYMLDYLNNKLRRVQINSGGIRKQASGKIDWWPADGPRDPDNPDDNTNKIWNSLEGYSHTIYDNFPLITANNLFIPYPENDRLQNPNLSRDKETEPYDFNKYGSE